MSKKLLIIIAVVFLAVTYIDLIDTLAKLNNTISKKLPKVIKQENPNKFFRILKVKH